MAQFDVIYADPAWSYEVWSKKGAGRTAAHHYQTTALDTMSELPVEKLAKPDCALFMWATYPNLPEALILGRNWGFTYKTVAFTWVKQNRKAATFFMGLGYWTRANPELCLLFTRGKPKRVSKSVRNLVVSHIRRHSEKPEEVRNRITMLMGDGLDCIELFARRKIDGWTTLGNEIDGKDLAVSIRETIDAI